MTLTLILPENFIPDPILSGTTPEQNALILTNGCIILHNILNRSILKLDTTLINQEHQEELKRAQDTHHTALRNIQDMHQKDLAKSQEMNEFLQKHIDDIRKDHQKHIMDLEDDYERRRAKDEESSRRFADVSDDISRRAVAELTATVREFRQMSSEHRQMGSELNGTIQRLKLREAVPQRKGNINELESLDLIESTFSGLNSNYEYIPKTINAGDHRFKWLDNCIMWEDKKYAGKPGKPQVDKAFRDFDLHRECNVLIFVSADTEIVSHGNFDVNVHDNRLVIFIGSLNSHPDKAEFIRSIIQPLILNLVPMLKRYLIKTETDEPNEEFDGLVSKLDTIRCMTEMQAEQMKAHRKILTDFEESHQREWSKVTANFAGIKTEFSRMLVLIVGHQIDDIQIASPIKKPRARRCI